MRNLNPVAFLTLSAAVLSAAPPPAPQVVAWVNGVPVKSDRLLIAMESLLPLASYHQNVSPEKMTEIRKNALDKVIDEELQYQDAVRLKLKVTDDDFKKSMDRVIQRYGSQKAFDEALKKSGAKLDDIKLSIKRVLMVQKAYEHEVAARCTVNNAEVVQFYSQNTARFVMPEQLHVYLITISVDPSGSRADWDAGRKRAEELLRGIHDQASFEEMARKESADPSKEKGGDLGFIHRGRMAAEFEESLKAMKPGQTSQVIQTIYGFHLLRLAEIRPPVQKTLEEVKDSLKKDLTEKRCGEMNDEWNKRLRASAKIEIVPMKTLEGPHREALLPSH